MSATVIDFAAAKRMRCKASAKILRPVFGSAKKDDFAAALFAALLQKR